MTKERFISLVCPECRSIAEDFINDQIDALFVTYVPDNGSCYRSRIEIFENDPDKPSKIIKFNDDENHIANDDIYDIRIIAGQYGDKNAYNALKRLDTDENFRNRIMKVYAKYPDTLTTIARKKCQKIYDSLSDSDKLLLEISDDNDDDPVVIYF